MNGRNVISVSGIWLVWLIFLLSSVGGCLCWGFPLSARFLFQWPLWPWRCFYSDPDPPRKSQPGKRVCPPPLLCSSLGFTLILLHYIFICLNQLRKQPNQRYTSVYLSIKLLRFLILQYNTVVFVWPSMVNYTLDISNMMSKIPFCGLVTRFFQAVGQFPRLEQDHLPEIHQS